MQLDLRTACFSSRLCHFHHRWISMRWTSNLLEFSTLTTWTFFSALITCHAKLFNLTLIQTKWPWCNKDNNKWLCNNNKWLSKNKSKEDHQDNNRCNNNSRCKVKDHHNRCNNNKWCNQDKHHQPKDNSKCKYRRRCRLVSTNQEIFQLIKISENWIRIKPIQIDESLSFNLKIQKYLKQTLSYCISFYIDEQLVHLIESGYE